MELFLAFGAGLISFLSPCVLPLIPGYISYISNTSFNEERHVNSTGFQKLAQFDATDSDSAGIKIMVFNPFDSSSFTFITSQTSTGVQSVMIGTKYIGVLKNTETVTGLRLGFTDSDGNLSSGGINDCIVNVYGVK